MNVLIIMCLLAMLTGAVVMDLRTGRITNRYNLCWIISGLVINLFMGGLKTFFYSLVGGLIPMAVLMILFKLGILGAGDIKLFGAVGTFVGLNIYWIVIYSFLLCGLYGVLLVVGRLVKSLASKEGVTMIMGFLGRKRQYTRVAFSIFIFGGYMWYLMMGGVGLGI